VIQHEHEAARKSKREKYSSIVFFSIQSVYNSSLVVSPIPNPVRTKPYHSIPDPRGTLDGIPIKRSLIPLLPLRLQLLPAVLRKRLILPIPARVLPPAPDRHNRTQRTRHRQHPNEHSIPLVEPRPLLRLEQESGDTAAEVTAADVHGDADTALGAAADVVPVPGDSRRDVGVDARGGEEAADIFDFGVVGGDEHREADYSVEIMLVLQGEESKSAA
jgi:hypothetical protein